MQEIGQNKKVNKKSTAKSSRKWRKWKNRARQKLAVDMIAAKMILMKKFDENLCFK